MTPAIRLIPASPAHVGTIARRMREADARECAAFGHSPKQALRIGLTGSVLTTTALVNGRPEGMFGVAPVNVIEGVGQPWLLGTDRVAACASALLRDGPGLVAAMQARFRTLENWVAADNSRAIGLLRRWGFAIGDEGVVMRGVELLPFRKCDV